MGPYGPCASETKCVPPDGADCRTARTALGDTAPFCHPTKGPMGPIDKTKLCPLPIGKQLRRGPENDLFLFFYEGRPAIPIPIEVGAGGRVGGQTPQEQRL